MLSRFFNFQTKTISRAAGILAFSYLISGFLGLIRDRLLAGKFGASLELDVYFAAFRIPDFVYNILILGGLIVAFLPLFSEYYSQKKEEAWQMSNYVLNAFLFFLILISLILFILSPWLLDWIFPGFGPEAKKLAVPLTQLLLLSPIFFGISNLLSGVLQYFNRFFIYSLTPIIYNLGIIFGILFLVPRFGIFGVGMGVILGAISHLVIQIPSAKNCGFSYQFLFNLRHPALKRIFKLMIPRVFGLTAQQINLIVITAIASTISVGSIAIFNFSNNLQSLPLSVIGVSFAVAIFPTLARTWAEKKKEEFTKIFRKIFGQILLLTIPLSILIFLFRNQIVKIILETGQFSPLDTKLTAASLGLFAFSIFAQSSIPLISRAFFSLQDTKTPTLIAIFSFTLNITLAFLLVWLLNWPNLFTDFIKNSFNLNEIENISLLGLPLAFSLSAIFQFLFLHLKFRQKIKKNFLN